MEYSHASHSSCWTCLTPSQCSPTVRATFFWIFCLCEPPAQESSWHEPSPSCQTPNSAMISSHSHHANLYQQSVYYQYAVAEKWKSHHQGSSHKHNSHTHIASSQSEACRNQTACTTALETASIHTETSPTYKPIVLVHLYWTHLAAPCNFSLLNHHEERLSSHLFTVSACHNWLPTLALP